MVERVSIQEASLRLNVSQRTIRECIRNGELRAFRQAGPNGESWVVELPAEGWLDSAKKAYLELARRVPPWWWPNEHKNSKVHYVQDLGVEEIMPIFICGLRSENIWSATGHTEEDRCPNCLRVAKERGLPIESKEQ
jgi:excisionase family DNA binding protein